MKKLVSTADLGGAPIYKSDLRELFNEELWDVIEAMFSPFDSDVQGVVVSGCVTTANASNFDMTAGVVYLNGEFMRITAVTNQAFTKYIAASTPTSDSRTFADSTTNDVVETKLAGLVASAPGTQYITISSLTDLNDRRLSTLMPKATTTPIDWTTITLINGWAVESSATPQYKIDCFGQVHFRGVLDGSAATGGGSAGRFAAIPVAIAIPATLNRQVSAHKFDGSSGQVALFNASPSGFWSSGDTTGNNKFYLDGISYWP